MLGGAYSSQYRTLEREHVETIKTIVEHGKQDAIARARKLSVETNKRRRALAIKRKTEAEKEEKRRQHILAKRRERQREATEKFQRAHISSRPTSGNSGKWSPTQVNTTRLDDALRIVRGSPRASSARNPGHTSPIRTLYRQDSDPVHRRSFNKYAHPTAATSTMNENLREKQAALHNKSLRNLTNSRNLFEQQLESHQQQLIHQQQKALQDFNEQVLHEIGVERPSAVNGNFNGSNMEKSDTSSLSSVDSLEETASNDTLRESVDLDSFIALKCGTGDQPIDTKNVADDPVKSNGNKAVNFTESGQTNNDTLTGNMGQRGHGQDDFDRESRSGKSGTSNHSQNNDAYNAQRKAQLSAQRIQEEKQKYYHQRQIEIQRQLEQQQQHKQLLLQQQQQQELQQKVLEQQQKQQALLQQHFQKQQEEHLERQRQQQQQLQLQQQRHQEYMKDQEKLQGWGGSTVSDEKENVRPKVQMKAWATPSPHPPASTPSVNSTQQNFVTHTSPYSGKNTHTNVTVTTYDTPVTNYSAVNVSNASAVQMTATVQPVHSLPSQHTALQTKSIKQETNATLHGAQNASQNVQTGAKTGTDKNLSFLETVTNNLDQVQNSDASSALTRTNSDRMVQYETAHVKSATENTHAKSVNEPKAQSSVKTVPSSPKVPAYQSYYLNSYAERYNASKVPYATETTTTTDSGAADGSIAKGTLGLVDGQLSVLPDGQITEEGADTADTDSVSTLCEDREPDIKEVKGILKKPNKVKTNSGILKKSGSTGNMRHPEIRDSLEITRVHLQTSAEEKHQKMLREQELKLNPAPVPTKKNVRFADLHYDEQEEQGESESDQGKLFVKRTDNVPHKPPRPASASAAKTTTVHLELKNKPTRAQSASTIRTSSIPRTKTQIVRPQAAAHIITQNLNNQNAVFSNPDKKVTIINNDFMEKVPAMARAQSAQVVHTVTPTSVFTMSSVSYSRPVEHKVNYAVSSIVMPQTDSPSGQSAPFIYPNYNAKTTPTPTSSSANPHQVIMNGANYDGAVYDENGIRIDRTPTDDEINFLWDKVRTCLSRNSQATPDKVNTPTSVVSDQQQSLPRQAAPMHHKYIDGNTLGQFNSLNRVAPQQSVYNTNLRRHNSMDNVNGYTKRYGLLQQRKQQPNPNSLKSRQQQTYTVYQTPAPSQQEPQTAAGIQPAQDVSESMAGFLAAEQLVDQSLSDSRIQQAIDDAQNRQQTLIAARQPKAKSALSVEEQRLLESLDRLNDKLKITEAVIQNGSIPDKQQKHTQQYTHVGGFRGHTPIISPQRRVIETPQKRATETANQKARLRITSAHIKRNIPS